MLWKNSTSPLSLICDIGSATVSLAVVDRSKEKPEIVYTTKVPIAVQDVFNQSELEKTLLSFFNASLQNIQKAFTAELASYKVKHIQNAYLIFSSPWYVTKISTVVIEKIEPFLLDERGIEEIIIEEEKKFESEALAGNYKNIEHKDLHVIERELVRVKLNGYETSTPYLKKVKHAELSIAMSLVPHNLLMALMSALSTSLHIMHSKSFTFPLVSFGAMRKLFPHDTDFLCVDVAGEMTDVSYIEDNIIVGSHSLSLARNALIRTVSKELALSSEMAVSQLALLTSGSLETEIAKKLESILDDYFKEWLGALLQAPAVLQAKDKGVIKIFLTANDDVAGLFLERFKKPELARYQVVLISDSATLPFVSYGKHVESDPFLSLETIFLEEKFL